MGVTPEQMLQAGYPVLTPQDSAKQVLEVIASATRKEHGFVPSSFSFYTIANRCAIFRGLFYNYDGQKLPW